VCADEGAAVGAEHSVRYAARLSLARTPPVRCAPKAAIVCWARASVTNGTHELHEEEEEDAVT